MWPKARHLVWLIAALLGLGSNLPALALDQGGGHLGWSYYSLRLRTGGQNINFSETYGFVDFYQKVTNYGVLDGRLVYSHLEEPDLPSDGWRRGYGRLSLKNYRLGRSTLDVSAGDQTFLWTHLPLRFSNYFYPMTFFRGFDARITHPFLQIEVLGGEVTRSYGLSGETFLGMGESLYGFLARSQPWERWILESGVFLTHNETDYTGKQVTNNNLVYRLGSQLQTWSRLYLLGEFMQSFAEIPSNRKVEDVAYRVGPMWRGERLRLEGNYRYFGPNFHLINQIYQPERAVEGLFLAGDYNPWPFLWLYGSYDSAQTNLLNDVSRSINETTFRSGGVRFYRQPWPSLFYRYTESNLATRGDFPVRVQGQSSTHYGEIIQRLKFMDIYARYTRNQFRDEINPASSYRKDVPLLGARSYHRRFSWYLEGEYDRYSNPKMGRGFDGLYLRAGGNYSFSSNLSLFGELTYRPRSNRYGGQLGINWKLPHGFYLRAYGRMEKATLRAGDILNDFSTNQVTLQISKAFGWGKKTRVAGQMPGQEWLGSGVIEGWVFNDANLNHARDTGEEGVEGVKIRLEDGSTVTTDAQGHYEFPAVAAGKHVVTMDTRRIPASYTFFDSETMAVEVKRRSSARVDFAFGKGAEIRGRVLEDTDGKGRAAPGAKGLPDVLVLLKPGDWNTYTDSEGNFFFEGLAPREYELSVHPETLPAYSRITSSEMPAKVNLKPGEVVRGLNFLVYHGRPIVFK
ncbi:MAG: hypothetical protein A2Z73_00275 [Deltaproteobacteria bacterium RBG_13_60_28]|nr:MAG: hypothetical protein A2Z73_00275 [Deltaproteobacteria bacterium RBG_13_60_28]